MFKVEGKAKRQNSGDLQGQVDSSAAALPNQDGLGGRVQGNNMTAHALSKNLNSAF